MMKFLIAFAAVAAVAAAVPVQRDLIVPALTGPTPVVDESGSPIAVGPAVLDLSPISVGPAIIETNPISVGPAIIETNPISVGPATVDFPLPDGGAVTAVEPAVVNPSPVVSPLPVIQPSPVVIGEIPPGATPLVQIIVNVNPEGSVVAPSPVGSEVAEEVYMPGPVNVVDNVVAPDTVINPIQVTEPIVPGPVNVVDNVVAPDTVINPVQVVEPIVPGPVNVVDNVVPVVVEPVQVAVPVVVEPVQVGAPIIPAPAVVLPDDLN